MPSPPGVRFTTTADAFTQEALTVTLPTPERSSVTLAFNVKVVPLFTHVGGRGDITVTFGIVSSTPILKVALTVLLFPSSSVAQSVAVTVKFVLFVTLLGHTVPFQ